MNINNPGLGDEVREHESIHVEQFIENYKNLKTIFKGKIYTGSIDLILTQIVNDNPNIFADATLKMEYDKKVDELARLGANLILKFGSRDNVENYVINKLIKRHPEKTKFYNNGTIPTIYQK